MVLLGSLSRIILCTFWCAAAPRLSFKRLSLEYSSIRSPIIGQSRRGLVRPLLRKFVVSCRSLGVSRSFLVLLFSFGDRHSPFFFKDSLALFSPHPILICFIRQKMFFTRSTSTHQKTNPKFGARTAPRPPDSSAVLWRVPYRAPERRCYKSQRGKTASQARTSSQTWGKVSASHHEVGSCCNTS